ncbi:MAG: DNA repair protein RecO [Betaproteobacteria bacterium]|nr:DNA repair protein RecO [Betaproteobacteria bacterium]
MNDLAAGLTAGRVLQKLVEKPAKASTQVSDRAFVLHTWPWRETSAIVEVFTRSHGRMGLVAKGAKRPKSAIRGVLQLFQPLHVQWFGKSEMKTLKSAEHEMFLPQLAGPALVSAFYLNELVMKLTHREVPHDGIFEAYAEAIAELSDITLDRTRRSDIGAVLRRFEIRFLRELGYGLQLEEEADTHAPISASERYWFVADRGAVRVNTTAMQDRDTLQIHGKTLVDMADDDFRDPETLAESKLLMRTLIARMLGDKVIFSRALMREMK